MKDNDTDDTKMVVEWWMEEDIQGDLCEAWVNLRAGHAHKKQPPTVLPENPRRLHQRDIMSAIVIVARNRGHWKKQQRWEAWHKDSPGTRRRVSNSLG